MNTIIMRGTEFEDITTYTFAFLTPSMEKDAINTAIVIEKLARRLNVFVESPTNIERYYRWNSRQSKWTITLEGTYTEIGLFVENTKNIVEECK